MTRLGEPVAEVDLEQFRHADVVARGSDRVLRVSLPDPPTSP
jgi:hypothetical protein